MYIQLIDPAAFGGADGFVRQIDWIAAACHGATPRPGVERVRLPGERGLALYRQQLDSGVVLYPGIIDALRPWGDRFGVALPAPL